MRLFKDDSINIKIHTVLKQKFHIAVGMLGLSSVITNFIQDYVRKYELQYGVIPVALSDDEKYDLITKVFGVSLDRASKRKSEVGIHLNILNEILGSEITKEEFLKLSELYPKTRKNITLNTSKEKKYPGELYIEQEYH